MITRAMGLDLGMHTGCAKWDGTLNSEVKHFKRKRTEPLLQPVFDFESWLYESLLLFRPQVVGYEKPFIKWPRAAEILYPMAFVVELSCHVRGIRCLPVGAKELKKWATGNGNATKQQMIAAANCRHWPVPGRDRLPETTWSLISNVTSSDEADAILVLAWVLGQEKNDGA